MASSKQGGASEGGNPTRHSGHSFALKDPERRREVPEPQSRPATVPQPQRARPTHHEDRREPAVAAGSDPNGPRRPDRDR